jgi:hypothetical protein
MHAMVVPEEIAPFTPIVQPQGETGKKVEILRAAAVGLKSC